VVVESCDDDASIDAVEGSGDVGSRHFDLLGGWVFGGERREVDCNYGDAVVEMSGCRVMLIPEPTVLHLIYLHHQCPRLDPTVIRIPNRSSKRQDMASYTPATAATPAQATSLGSVWYYTDDHP
jgi:hypothetical protein